jgi:hypothetical protein
LVRRGGFEGELPIAWVTFCASVSGSVSSAVCSPFEMVKSRAMLSRAGTAAQPNSSPARSSVLQQEAAQLLAVVRAGGAGALFKGLPLLWLRDFPGTGAFLGSYELVKRLAQRQEISNSAAGFAAGLVAGPVGWIVPYPAEVVRIHWQSNGVNGRARAWPSYLACARDLYAQGGVRMFYRGLPACCARSALQISVTMAVFEKLREYFL